MSLKYTFQEIKAYITDLARLQMDNLKPAFDRVKQDIFSLGSEIQQLKLGMEDLKAEIRLISSFMDDLKLKLVQNTSNLSVGNVPTDAEVQPTIRHQTPTQEDIPTDKLLSQVLKSQKIQFSSGNGGVPTDRQTDQQTDRHTLQHTSLVSETPIQSPKESRIDHLEKAAEILDSLDALKKEVRRKFKQLTNQEMAVFSLLYQLEAQGNQVDYPLLSSKLRLSESSIRDYIIKIQKKGVPITKEKLNNKRVILHISQDLRKIASLDTILKLREI